MTTREAGGNNNRDVERSESGALRNQPLDQRLHRYVLTNGEVTTSQTSENRVRCTFCHRYMEVQAVATYTGVPCGYKPQEQHPCSPCIWPTTMEHAKRYMLNHQQRTLGYPEITKFRDRQCEIGRDRKARRRCTMEQQPGDSPDPTNPEGIKAYIRSLDDIDAIADEVEDLRFGIERGFYNESEVAVYREAFVPISAAQGLLRMLKERVYVILSRVPTPRTHARLDLKIKALMYKLSILKQVQMRDVGYGAAMFQQARLQLHLQYCRYKLTGFTKNCFLASAIEFASEQQMVATLRLGAAVDEGSVEELQTSRLDLLLNRDIYNVFTECLKWRELRTNEVQRKFQPDTSDGGRWQLEPGTECSCTCQHTTPQFVAALLAYDLGGNATKCKCNHCGGLDGDGYGGCRLMAEKDRIFCIKCREHNNTDWDRPWNATSVCDLTSNCQRPPGEPVSKRACIRKEPGLETSQPTTTDGGPSAMATALVTSVVANSDCTVNDGSGRSDTSAYHRSTTPWTSDEDQEWRPTHTGTVIPISTTGLGFSLGIAIQHDKDVPISRLHQDCSSQQQRTQRQQLLPGERVNHGRTNVDTNGLAERKCLRLLRRLFTYSCPCNSQHGVESKRAHRRQLLPRRAGQRRLRQADRLPLRRRNPQLQIHVCAC